MKSLPVERSTATAPKASSLVEANPIFCKAAADTQKVSALYGEYFDAKIKKAEEDVSSSVEKRLARMRAKKLEKANGDGSRVIITELSEKNEIFSTKMKSSNSDSEGSDNEVAHEIRETIETSENTFKQVPGEKASLFFGIAIIGKLASVAFQTLKTAYQLTAKTFFALSR